MPTPLFHYSEDPTIEQFIPRVHPSHPDEPAMVWAIDELRSPMYLLPRECPRIAYWSLPSSSRDDIDTIMGRTEARMIVAIEGKWLEVIRDTPLYVYRFDSGNFKLFDSGAGYYVSHEAVTPHSVEPVGDLLTALTCAGVELHITPSLRPIHDALLQSTLHYSMIRMRNASLKEKKELPQR